MSVLQKINDLPRRVPFFYGWCVAGGAVMGVMASIPGQTMGVSVFTPKLIEATGLTSQQLSMAYGIGTITSGLLLVRAGRLIDIIGVRVMMTLACIGLGLVLCFFANMGRVINALGETTAVIIPMAIATVSFFALRFTGQGLMTMSPRVMMGKWWDKRRGRISGFMGIFTAFAFGSAPFFLSKFIEWFEWQGAYYFMGSIVGIVVAFLCWLIYREQPQDYGLVPDGHYIKAEYTDEPEKELRHFELSAVRRSYAFWVFVMGLGGNGLIITGITFHIVAMSEAAGLTQEQGVAIFLPMSVLSVASNFIGGWMSDKTPLKNILMFMMAFQAMGTLAFIDFGNPVWRGFAILGYGVSGGLWGVLVNVTWPRFYGTLHLGAISGQSGSVMVMASAVGPLIFATSMERMGSYGPGLVLCSLIPISVLIAATRVKNPQTFS
jgi:sugar phosphate permease